MNLYKDYKHIKTIRTNFNSMRQNSELFKNSLFIFYKNSRIYRIYSKQ